MDEPLGQMLIIRPARSFYLLLFIVCVHMGSVVAMSWSGLPIQIKLLGVLVVMLNFLRLTRKWSAVFTDANAVVFMLTPEGDWLRRDVNGGLIPLIVLPSVFVHPWLTVVRLRSVSGTDIHHDLVLLPDSLDLDSTRRLRVRLRFPP